MVRTLKVGDRVFYTAKLGGQVYRGTIVEKAQGCYNVDCDCQPAWNKDQRTVWFERKDLRPLSALDLLAESL
jgi:hypothetical protein